MGSPCPPHWTFAARAAYFGDRMCAFCDHRNPAGAKFCNNCASPLHLKPCKQCDTVNHQSATNCYKCGAACPEPVIAFDATSSSPVADPAPARAAPADAAVVATTTEPRFAASASRAGGRLPMPRQLLLAAIATILTAGAYTAYRFHAATPDAMPIASQPPAIPEQAPAAAIAAVPEVVESQPVEPETTATLQPPIPATGPEAPTSAGASLRTPPPPATKPASTHQRPVHERQAPVGATPRAANRVASAHVHPRGAGTRKAVRPDRWHMMNVSLARCSGDFFARLVCDQRVRRHFCEGHWGKAPQCPSGIANDHGQ